MKQIESQMVSAIASKRNWMGANTSVSLIPMGGLPIIEVRLHGNLIAQIGLRSDTIRMTLAGWNTVTSRSRLNALCQVFAAGHRFNQKAFEPYFDDKPLESSSDWVEVPLSGYFNSELRASMRAAREAGAEWRAAHPATPGLEGPPMEEG